ncbi:MAG: hypothetical protein Q9160_009317 [Pyrenula sp. 1 TL-2023]
MFERNYLSRIIRYSTQDTYWGRVPNHEPARAASRIGRLRDPGRPRKLTDGQRQQVWQNPQVLQLGTIRDNLHRKTVADFGHLKLAIGEPICDNYHQIGRELNAATRAEERALLKRIQSEYDRTAPILAIQRQLNGAVSEDEHKDIESTSLLIRFPERQRIAEATLIDSVSLTSQEGFQRHIDFCNNLIDLCDRQERRLPNCHMPDQPSVKAVENRFEPSDARARETPRGPLKCQLFQCLFCLTTSGLSRDDQEHRYASKISLQRHADRCRLNKFEEGDGIPCPDSLTCNGLLLHGKLHFKTHAAKVHNFVL